MEPYSRIRERDLIGRDGLFVAEGKIVLSMLAQSSDYELQSVLLLESRLQPNADLLNSIADDIPVYSVKQQVLDSIAGFHVHRGVLAIGRKTRTLSLADMLASNAEDSLIVVMSGISNHDNVGSIFRNAAAFSANGVILDDQCCDPLYRKAVRVSVGGVLTVPWTKDRAIHSIIGALNANNYAIAALSPSGKRLVQDLPAKGKRALLLGSEGHGLPSALLARLDTYRIPMSRDFDSLNVATASGIALFSASAYAA